MADSAPAPAAAPAPLVLNLNPTMGALYIGVLLGAVLFGVSCLQVWGYFTNYGKDRWFVKSLVAAVFISDTVHQILISHSVYHYLVTNFANPLALTMITWSIVIEVLFNAITAYLVQFFFIYRIFVLSAEKMPVMGRVIAGVIFALSTAGFGLSVTFTVKALSIPGFDRLPELNNLVYALNTIGAAVDIFIAIAMVHLLQLSRTGFRQSNNMINRLMLFVINTGLLTSLFAIATLIAVGTSPGTFIYIFFYFVLGRLYSNSLLASLNARDSLRATGQSSAAEEFQLSFGNSRGGPSVAGRSRGTGSRADQLSSVDPTKSTNININVERTTDFSRDDDL